MDVVYPGDYVALRTPSDLHKLVEIQPHITIPLGKYGSFEADLIIGRPYHLTYEILDEGESKLRVVPPAEQYTYVKGEDDFETMPMPEELVLTPPTANGTPTENPDTKSGFTLAKYQLKRSRKSTKQFTVLPLDVLRLTNWMLLEKRVTGALEIREEMLAQLMSWANVHSGGDSQKVVEETGDRNRWLVVDESGGIVVAAMAERMGILYRRRAATPFASTANGTTVPRPSSPPEADAHSSPITARLVKDYADPFMSATSNTITVVHAHGQPHLACLQYFNYDPSNPDANHPLHSHLHTLSFLQLLHPEEDSTYTEPPLVSDSVLATWKTSRRGAYYRKRRRWQRVKTVVDSARRGGFSGLVIAAAMEPAGILRHLVPLVRGGGQVAVFAPAVEPLIQLQDLYSTARKGAWLGMSEEQRDGMLGGDDFPVDPTALLATTINTVRARPWQVLPGRTHPVMHDRGGAEGYVFVGTKVLPGVGIMARGSMTRKKRKVEAGQPLEEGKME